MYKKPCILILMFLTLGSHAKAQDITCAYFTAEGSADGNTATHYVSKMRQFRFSDNKLTFSKDGEMALGSAKQQWETSVYRRFDDSITAAVVRKPSHLDCNEFEKHRLDDMKHYRDINGYLVIEW
jgi:hypothetical protein